MPAWTMTEDGEFILNEEYERELQACKLAGSRAFIGAVVARLVEVTDYSPEEIGNALNKKVEGNIPNKEMMDSFIPQVLEGDL